MVLGGCERKADSKTQMAELEKVFPGLGDAPHWPADAAVSGDAKESVGAAISALRSNDYATGVILLHSALRRPGLTGQQVKVIQETSIVLIGELNSRASRGDESAKAALTAIENAP